MKFYTRAWRFYLIGPALILGLAGCETTKNLGYYKQPPLHDPVITNSEPLRIAAADFSLATNGGAINLYSLGNLVARVPSNALLTLSTNGGQVYASTNGSPVLGSQARSFGSGSGGINAYLQIESNDDAAEQFGRTFASCFYVGELGIDNTNDKDFLAKSSSIQVMVSYYLSKKDWDNPTNNIMRANVVRRYGGEFIRQQRHPLTYEEILSIFQFQQDSDPRQQLFNYIESAGEIASGATIFIGGALYPTAVDFAIGIVEPQIKKRLLWDLIEHQQNFAARGLQSTIDVAPQSSVSGVVFFPKRPISGLVDGHNVYLSSFNSSEKVRISGSLAQKTGAASSASPAPPAP